MSASRPVVLGRPSVAPAPIRIPVAIHSGGMVICDRPIADVCPVEWARMENRSVLQWDKDDCAAIGLVKFDLLGLGMLSALHYAIDLVAEHKGIEVDLAKLDLSEPAVYEMLQRADSVGVFQVESRAQMATLPRLRASVRVCADGAAVFQLRYVRGRPAHRARTAPVESATRKRRGGIWSMNPQTSGGGLPREENRGRLQNVASLRSRTSSSSSLVPLLRLGRRGHESTRDLT